LQIRYIVQLKESIQIEDHWPISIMGGTFDVISKNGKASAFVITFKGQPVDLAPEIERHEEGEVKFSIVGRDTLLPCVRMRLEKAFTYLQCYFDVEILIKEVAVEYVGETREEESKIKVKGQSTQKQQVSPLIPYNLLTRAIMASENGEAPEFEATLLGAARSAMLQSGISVSQGIFL